MKTETPSRNKTRFIPPARGASWRGASLIVAKPDNAIPFQPFHRRLYPLLAETTLSETTVAIVGRDGVMIFGASCRRRVWKMQNLYRPEAVSEVIARIDRLQPTTQHLWGKMDVAQ